MILEVPVRPEISKSSLFQNSETLENILVKEHDCFKVSIHQYVYIGYQWTEEHTNERMDNWTDEKIRLKMCDFLITYSFQ